MLPALLQLVVSLFRHEAAYIQKWWKLRISRDVQVTMQMACLHFFSWLGLCFVHETGSSVYPEMTKWRRKWHDADIARVAQDLGRLCITWWGEFLLKFWEDEEFFFEMFLDVWWDQFGGCYSGGGSLYSCVYICMFRSIGHSVLTFQIWESKIARNPVADKRERNIPSINESVEILRVRFIT